MADIVNKVNADLPKKKKFYQRSCRFVPLALAAAACEMECQVSVLRTFIEVRVPSSLYSVTGKADGTTASSTDAAEGHKGCSHRTVMNSVINSEPRVACIPAVDPQCQ